MILASLTVVVAGASAIGTLTDVPDKVDPWIHTESEAVEEHAVIVLASEEAQQTQAGFNAYTLKAILMQEIAILKLRIEAEDDAEEKDFLVAELKHKQAFIRQLEEEARKQLLKGETG